MAFLNANEEEDDENGGVNPSAPTTGAESSTLSAGGTPGAGPTQASPQAPTKSSNFVGIQQYIDANKDQTQKLANSLSSDVTNQADAAKSTIKTGVNNVTNRINSGATLPKTFESSNSYKPAKAAVDQALTSANVLGSDEGRRQLLEDRQRKEYGTVNQGALDLDSALLGTDQSARSTIGKTQQGVLNTLPSAFQKASTNVDKQIKTTLAKRSAEESAKRAAAELLRTKKAEAEKAAAAAANKAAQIQAAAKVEADKKAKELLNQQNVDNVAATVKKDAVDRDLINQIKNKVGVRKIQEHSMTFVCTELYLRGLISSSELKALHKIQLNSFARRGRFAAWYIDNGPLLVEKGNKLGFNWECARKWFVDDVLKQTDVIDREEAYGRACQMLCACVFLHVWDERVMRNSYLDSVRFLPKILLFRPHREMMKSYFRRMKQKLIGASYA